VTASQRGGGCCGPGREGFGCGRLSGTVLFALTLAMGFTRPAFGATEAPPWLHALTSVPLPAHDDKTEAVILTSETTLTVSPSGQLKHLLREGVKILRPEGEGFGTIRADYTPMTRITALHAWSIPAAGKDYAVKDKDAVETSLYGVMNGELATDMHSLVLQIPAAVPGSIVGWEQEQDERPYQLIDEWDFQESVPTREANYTLHLPPGWSYRAVWLNHAEVRPVETTEGEVRWTLGDEPAVPIEAHMPPWRGIAGRLVVTLLPPNPQAAGMQTWSDLGVWHSRLTRGRRDVSPEIRAKVAELTAGVPDLLGKMRALAAFVQSDIRYVAIELGIGGFQPHAAAEVFSLRYGDCKDKATLLSAMLSEIGVDSYYLIINTERGAVTATTPPNLAFNHAILAIRLPDGIADPTLLATSSRPPLGRLLYFDPTDDLTPFGSLRGPLQANFALLVHGDGGELIELPQLDAGTNGNARTAKLTLAADGSLSGEVREHRLGDAAVAQREALRSVSRDTEQIKPIESLLAGSLADFEILRAQVANQAATDKPLDWIYEFKAEHYAKASGDLLVVRPRVLGSRALGFLERPEPRRQPIEFSGPERDTDVFEITLPTGFAVEDLPDPVQLKTDFATYQSKTEVVGQMLRYTRVFEIEKVSLPAARAPELRSLYRTIAGDERGSVVLKRVAAN
jgi:hypothetical protein